MKNLFIFSLGLFVTLFVSMNNLFAQTLPSAQVTSELYITLDYTAPSNTKVFEADLTEFNFQSIEAANRFFSFFNDPSVTFETNIATQKVVITLVSSTDRQSWTMTEWQTYLKNKIVEQRNQLGFVDFTTR
ncbi:hypothetical protein ACE193_10120 [Bernardetia sp. OM2101]|uniref:hypothetical protein n=1 Tax=Bernardetia sp. OM2101 TaxID=3344876 RepID=UPI0035D04D37